MTNHTPCRLGLPRIDGFPLGAIYWQTEGIEIQPSDLISDVFMLSHEFATMQQCSRRTCIDSKLYLSHGAKTESIR